ncbi:MAG: acetoin utilization protein AcuC [Proteobacteria bacterium]|nr:acetoin utilization protein AcuC [Pseudomonadota bacterium]
MTGRRTVFFGSEIYRRQGFGDNHPLAIPRVGLVIELCQALGWLPDGFEPSPPASIDELTRFHAADYIAAVQRCDGNGRAEIEDRERYNLGTRENPVFEGLFARARTSCGGSSAAAKVALAGGIGFNPAGGTHHGMPDRAHGFCYFNDPVMAILTLLEGGAEPVLYLDLDAHHGDGVELAFANDPRVATISIHEAGRWPNTGTAHGPAGSNVYNFPVPHGFNDSEINALIEGAILPIKRALRPAAVVVTCGADGLAGDPLAGMLLSNAALWSAVEAAIEAVPGAVVLGGGGYNPWTAARCWSGLWGRLNVFETNVPILETMRRRFAELSCDLIDDEDVNPVWFESLEDPPSRASVRAEVSALLENLPAPHVDSPSAQPSSFETGLWPSSR